MDKQPMLEDLTGVLAQEQALMGRRAFTAGLAATAALVLAGCGSRGPSITPSEHEPPHPGHGDNEGGIPPLPEQSASYLERSPNENVAGLGDLEARCEQPGMFGGVMQILDASAPDARAWQVAGLSQSVQAGLRPLSIIEPISRSALENPEGNSRSINKYFQALFGGLDQAGVKPEELGPVALCPEFVAGFGGNPRHYARNLNFLMGRALAAEANAPVSNMIDLSEADTLLPYLGDVETNSLTSVGFQAFANAAPIPFDGQGRADVSGFLSAGKIKEVLHALGGAGGEQKPMWLNTGITREDAKLGVKYNRKQRMAIAAAIAEVVDELRSDGVEVLTVNLFAENKLNGKHSSDNAERRDFSFHPGDEEIVTSFAAKMKSFGIPLSGFAFAHDTAK